VALEARDGYPLAATWYQPSDVPRTGAATSDARTPSAGPGRAPDAGSGRAPRAAVLVAPAVAVRRSFYAEFAGWLAGRGLPVLTLDYRGTGGSRPDALSDLQADLFDVARRDLPAALDWLEARHPGVPLAFVGHSLGAQLFGLMPDPGRVRRLLSVTGGSGHWRWWPAPHRWLLAALWWIGMPGLTAVFGRFPSRMVGLGDDLPPGIARNWARWCRHRGYVVDDEGRPVREGYRGYRGAVRAYSFEDDVLGPRRAVEELLDWFEGAEVEHRHLAPSELGRDEVGHFGFFRSPSEANLWPEAASWLAGEGDGPRR
jgi:predicted alpha/beta hydrolase